MKLIITHSGKGKLCEKNGKYYWSKENDPKVFTDFMNALSVSAKHGGIILDLNDIN